MGSQPDENGYVVAMGWNNSGDAETMISTFGLIDNTPGRTPDTVANVVETAITTAGVVAGAIMIVNWNYEGFVLTQEQAAGDLVVERPTSVDGDLAENGCPSNCALLIRKRTLVGGKRNRGRMYLPAAYLPEEQVSSNGDLDPVWAENIQNRWLTLLAELSNNDLFMVVWHSAPPLTGTVVSSLTVDGKIATQRRRMR